MRTKRSLAILLLASTLSPLAAGCDSILSACVYNQGEGPCDEWVPRATCESSGGVYHDATTCSDLGLPSPSPPSD
jgi:hypothetical protein